MFLLVPKPVLGGATLILFGTDTLLGCVALKALGDGRGEIKSMHVVAESRGEGVGSALLRRVLDEARRRGYRRLSLETGSAETFEPARSLYRRHGFVDCGAFGDYVEDVHSTFMTRSIDG